MLASHDELLSDAIVAGAGTDAAGRMIRGTALTVVVVNLHLQLLALELLLRPISLGAGPVSLCPHRRKQ